MKLLFFSSAPQTPVGYGVATKALVSRMLRDGHEVRVATKHALGGNVTIDGIEVFEGIDQGLLNKIIVEEDYDYLISLMDAWVLKEPFQRWVCAMLLDTHWIHPKMINILKGSRYQIALTKHGKEELERSGFKPFYAPLGVDTTVFKPDLDLRKKVRESWGWDEKTFVIGLVGLNYPGDRKNIINLIRAYQRFHLRHADSVLYVHTDVMGVQAQGHPLLWVAEKCGFPEGNTAFRFVDQVPYHLRRITAQEMVGVYNSFDVFCLPHKGEGFGLPLIEAQACGCPIITTETTSGKELMKGGWLIPTKDDQFTISTLLTWVVAASPTDIDEQLEEAYKAWSNGTIGEERKKAHEGMKEYDWDFVYKTYWRPVLQELERKPVIVEDCPRYFEIYSSFSGRLFMIDCARLCENPEICKSEYPCLSGEEATERPILSRSFPIFPNEKGELLLSSFCPPFRWVSPRFISECRRTWELLWTYPKVRREIAELWGSGRLSSWGPFIKLEEVERTFDDGYARAMQTNYWTTFEITDDLLSLIPQGGKVLDVGTGDARRVKFLREKGFNALGTEVNPRWVTNGLVTFGDAEKLPFKDSSFDCVFCIDVLEHLKHPLEAVSELLRVSKKFVVVQITTTEDPTYYEDVTHCVPWTLGHWKRELSEFGKLAKALPLNGFVLEKEGTHV